MLKAVGTITDGAGERPALIIGLTRADVDKLTGGEEPMFECAAIGLRPMRVVLIFGDDDQAVRDRLGAAPAAPGTATGAGPGRTRHYHAHEADSPPCGGTSYCLPGG